MSNLRKSMLAMGVVGMWLMVSAHAQTTANGPYYATPSWDQQLPASTRFIVLSNFASVAVLDRETGLVWEKAPSTSRVNWFNALRQCIGLNAGGRKGWRLPTLQELLSLVDQSVSFPGPTLPSGHPFSNVQSVYWTATLVVQNNLAAWVVSFGDGTQDDLFSRSGDLLPAWCVRGGPGLAAQ